MWKVWLIGTTLIDGLWFEVSKVNSRVFRIGLLMLAAFGDVGLMIVLLRLRHIIVGYLNRLNAGFPDGHVAAPKKRFLTGEATVKLVAWLCRPHQGRATAVTMLTDITGAEPRAGDRAAAWYDANAERLASDYERFAFGAAHPELLTWASGQPPLSVLDVGCGTGRDAAALAGLGHDVVAIDPSAGMRRVARRMHPHARVHWAADALPRLDYTEGRFDLVLLSAVWMHVAPADRPAALRRLTELVAPSGRMHVTLRLGDAEAGRGVHRVSVAELEQLASRHSLELTDLGEQADLLGRSNVAWRTVVLRRI